MTQATRYMLALGALMTLLSFTATAQPGGGQCGGWGAGECDTLRQVVTVSGSVMTVQDSSFCAGTLYYLDADADGVEDYMLGFGPYWYTPTGLSRPADGQSVSITGYLNDTVTPQHIRVIGMDGSTWRDTTGTPGWGGGWVGQHGRQFRAQDSSVCTFPGGSYGRRGGGMMGRHWSDSVYCRFDTTTTPFWQRGGSAQGWHLTVSSSRGGMMMGEGYGGAIHFNTPVSLTLRYDEHRFGDEDDLALWRYEENGWSVVTGATVDTDANTVTVEENPLHEFYTVAPMSVTGVETATHPSTLSLHQNYPNPFNPSTTISYTLDARSQVTLRVFDLQGREVALLRDGVQDAGTHHVSFEAGGLTSGVYVCTLTAGQQTMSRKLVLEK